MNISKIEIIGTEISEPAPQELLPFEQEALKKKVDLLHDELVIHGTFIENLEDILKNGLGGSKSKRQYSGYGKPYSNPYDQPLPWEDEFGAGVYFSRINNTPAFVLHNFAELPPLAEAKNIFEQEIIDEKQLQEYNQELQKALTKYFEDKKLISRLDQITLQDLVGPKGQPKEINVQLEDGTEKIIFYDIDGWLKVRSTKPKPFSWPLFSDNYPIHLILRPDFFTLSSRYRNNFKYHGETIPPEAIIGLVITLDSIGIEEKLQDEEKEWLKEKLSRLTYIPQRHQQTGEFKEIKREPLIRFVRSLLKRLSQENLQIAMPIYNEKGEMIFP